MLLVMLKLIELKTKYLISLTYLLILLLLLLKIKYLIVSLNAKINGVKNTIRNITDLATNTALIAVENKIPDRIS